LQTDMGRAHGGVEFHQRIERGAVEIETFFQAEHHGLQPRFHAAACQNLAQDRIGIAEKQRLAGTPDCNTKRLDRIRVATDIDEIVAARQPPKAGELRRGKPAHHRGERQHDGK
jgi:hypothetical protein